MKAGVSSVNLRGVKSNRLVRAVQGGVVLCSSDGAVNVAYLPEHIDELIEMLEQAKSLLAKASFVDNS